MLPGTDAPDRQAPAPVHPPTADNTVAEAIGEILKELGGQVQRVSDRRMTSWRSGTISEKLKR